MEKSEKTVGQKVAIVAAVAAAVAFLVWGNTTDSNGNGDHPDEGISRGEAWNACKEAVTEHLRNPESADFALLSTDIAEQPDGGWSIGGTVDAQNDFGVETEIGYSCAVSPEGSVTVDVAP